MERIVQYIVVRGDLAKTLQWPVGAVIAQCCHAATSICYETINDPETKEYFSDMDNMHKVVLEVILFLGEFGHSELVETFFFFLSIYSGQ